MADSNISKGKRSERSNKLISWRFFFGIFLTAFILVPIWRVDVAEGCWRSDHDKCRFGDVKGIAGDLATIKNMLDRMEQDLNRIKENKCKCGGT